MLLISFDRNLSKKLYDISSWTVIIIAKSMHTNAMILKRLTHLFKMSQKIKYTLQSPNSIRTFERMLKMWFVLNDAEIHLTVVIRFVISFDREARHLQFDQTIKQTYWSQFYHFSKTFFSLAILVWGTATRSSLNINLENIFWNSFTQIKSFRQITKGWYWFSFKNYVVM